MKCITLYLPEKDLEEIRELVKKKIHPNRSEAIRFSVKHYLLHYTEAYKK